MTVVLLGNVSPLGVEGNSITTFIVPDDVGALEAIRTVADTWTPYHSDDPPEWVESDNDVVADGVAEHFGCKVGRPKKWDSAGADRTLENPTGGEAA